MILSTIANALTPKTPIEAANAEVERRRSEMEAAIAKLDTADPDDVAKWGKADAEARRCRAAFDRAERVLEDAIAHERDVERKRKLDRHAALHRDLIDDGDGDYAATIRRYADRMKAAAEELQKNERELFADATRIGEKVREVRAIEAELGLERKPTGTYPHIVEDLHLLLQARVAAFGVRPSHTFGRWLRIQLDGVEAERPGGAS